MFYIYVNLKKIIFFYFNKLLEKIFVYVFVMDVCMILVFYGIILLFIILF